MKKGWQIKKLGEVLKVQNGYAFNSKLFTAELGTPLIRIRDIKNGTRTETNFNGPYDRKYEVKAGDFLIGMDGEFGCYEWKGGTALLNQRVCRLQDFSDKLHPKYLFYGINKYLKAIEDVTAYATVKHISSKQIEAIEIPLPPLSEQQRIVSILDCCFAAIDKARANAERNLKNARELFESYLKGVFEEGDWEMKRLSEVAKHSLGKMLDKNKNKGKLKEYLRNQNVRWFEFDLSDLNEMPFLENENEKYTAIKGDVMICEGGYPGRAAIWEEDYPIYFQKAIHRVRFHDEGYNKWFLLYLFILDKTGKLKDHFTGTGIQHFTGDALSKLIIPFPPLNKVRTIVCHLEALREQTKKLEAVYQKKLADLEELKKSVLEKAFRGELGESV